MTRLIRIACVLGYALTSAATGIGCVRQEAAPFLVPPKPPPPAPVSTRVALTFEGGEEEIFLHPGRANDLHRFAGTTTPFEQFIYDADRDRFVLPGFWAIDRSGRARFDPEPLAGPPGAAVRPSAELRGALGRSPDDVEVILAVWYGEDAIVVLCSERVPNKRTAHQRRMPDALLVERLDPSSLERLDETRLALAEGWRARSTLARFLRDGTVVAAVAAPAWYRRWFPIPTPQGSRHPTVRIEPLGEVELVRRGRWYSAGVTDDGEVVGVVERSGRAALLGLDRDDGRRFRVELERPGLVATHAGGVCILDSAWPAAGATIACFDRNARLQWRRRTPGWVNDWMVDDAGWIYLVATYGRGERPTIVAVNPAGSIAWSLPAAPPPGGMMAAGEDLCFVTEAPPDARSWKPELVCIGPRHGRGEERTAE